MSLAMPRAAGRFFALLLSCSLVAGPALAQPAPPRPDNASKGTAPAAATTPAPADGAAPADGTAPADAEVAPAPEPPPPKPGHVVIVADAEGLVAELGGAVHGLKVGENRIEIAAGDWTVAVRDKAGKAVGSWSVHVDPEGEAKVEVVTTGLLVVPIRDGRSVEVDGKAVEAKGDRVEIRRSAGKVPVVVKEPGKTGVKGEVELVAGKTATIDPSLQAFDPGNKTLAWSAILGGGALVLAGTLMEPFVDASSFGGDATRWAMVGVGTAAFVGGTILMKDILAKENNPPVKDGNFDVRLAAGRKGGMASLALRF